MEIKAKWTGGRSFETVGPSGHIMQMDAAKNFGGDNSAPTPAEMLLSAVAGCIGIDVTMILKPHLASISKFDINVVGTYRDEMPKALTAVTIQFIVEGRINSKKVWRAINLAHEKYCAVSASLNADVKHELILNGVAVEYESDPVLVNLAR